MQKVKYINPNGREMVIANSPPFILESISGIGAIGTQLITTAGAAQDGKSCHDVRLEDREITVKFHIEGASLADMYQQRRNAIRLTASTMHRNGKLGRLIYTNDYGSWQIPCMVKVGVNADKRIKTFNHCTIIIYCPSPYWRSLQPDTERLTYLDAGLEFPLELDSELQIQFGTRGYENVIYNYGDAPAPLKITITGPATQPEIIKRSTGEFIRISRRELQEGDKLYINTDPDNLEATIIRTNGTTEPAFGYVDLGTTFFLADPGENKLEYQSGDDTTTALVEIEAQSWFGGV